MKMTCIQSLDKRLLLIFMAFISHYAMAASEEELSPDPELEIRDETVYVRDTLYVPLRGGQSTEHRILHQGLKSGTALTRLGINETSGYSKVVTKSGMIGWIPSQYLVQEPGATIRLTQTTKQLEELQRNHNRTVEQLDDKSIEFNAAKDELSKLLESNSTLQDELTTIQDLAADVMTIDARNEELKLEQSSLNDQINLLIESNEELRDRSAQSWFVRGAGAVLLSLIFGFFIARRMYLNNGGGWR